MPESGQWASEAVFSIPVAPTIHVDKSGFPGLIVFECTPLEGVTDDLERFDIHFIAMTYGFSNRRFESRKYRILDDCSRLRDIIKSFPPKRHFLPSLLVLSWAEVEQAKSPSDLIEMVRLLGTTLISPC